MRLTSVSVIVETLVSGSKDVTVQNDAKRSAMDETVLNGGDLQTVYAINRHGFAFTIRLSEFSYTGSEESDKKEESIRRDLVRDAWRGRWVYLPVSLLCIVFSPNTLNFGDICFYLLSI